LKTLPNIKRTNEEKFLNVLRKFDPELYMIRSALNETNLDPILIPHIIRQLGNLLIGTGYGKIQIFMQAKVVTQIKGEESVEINKKGEKLKGGK